MRIVVLVLALGAVNLAAAFELPQPFVATLHGRPLYVGSLQAEIALERTGDYLKYSMRTTGELLVHHAEVYDCSVMLVRDGKIRALEHRHTDSNKRSRDAWTRFNWAKGTATVALGSGREKQVSELSWPVWDPMSLQVQIMTDLLNGRLNGETTYRLLERGRLREWPLRRSEEGKLRTEHAEVQAVSVGRTDGQSYQVWFAKDYQYLPVLVELDNIRVQLISDPAAARRPAVIGRTDIPHC